MSNVIVVIIQKTITQAKAGAINVVAHGIIQILDISKG